MLMLITGNKDQHPNFKRLLEFPLGNDGTGPVPAAAPRASYFLDPGTRIEG